MLKKLRLKNVGPASTMKLQFGNRLNLFTGDNGLGKSFLLDIAWWALTRKWPAEINPRLTGGKKTVPNKEGESASIAFEFAGKIKHEEYESTFLKKEQCWTGRAGRPANPGLVLYAMSDGSFAVWDPARNYWRTQDGVDIQERTPAYVFSPTEVWDGLPGPGNTWLCNGLIRDWVSWQKENKRPFKLLTDVLKVLSPSAKQFITPGEFTRISLDDARDIPTIRMPYGQNVAVIHASSGMRRIMALAYFLVWAWEEHKQAAKQIGEKDTHQITFLIDEIESHLHPSWQLTIVPALLRVVESLASNADVQLITATHSPLVMTSVEPLFDSNHDAWFDLDFEGRTVKLRQRKFEKQGDAATWLLSEAFDLPSGRAIEYRALVEDAAKLLEAEDPTKDEISKMNQQLVDALSPADDFLFRWRCICKRKGWLS
jgi:predicted ATPase